MTEASFIGWAQQQITFGNIAAICSTLIAFGYQLRRLQDIERDISEVRAAQARATSDTASTYARRDVLAETLQSMNARLGNIETDLREVKHTTSGARR